MSKEKKGIFSATFEESLNFEDDALLAWYKKDIEAKGKEKNSIFLFFLLPVLIGLLYGFCHLTRSAVVNPDPDSLAPKAEINFLPFWLFWLCFIFFVFFWLYSHWVRVQSNRLFWGHASANNFLLWLFLEVNLMLVTMFFQVLTVWGILGIYILQGFFLALLSKKQIIAMQKLLYLEEQTASSGNLRRDKIIQRIIKFGSVAIAIYMLFKIIFPEIGEIRADGIGILGIAAMWFIMNFAVMGLEIYLMFPFFLQGYYKSKYSEEYRKWEGKTQVEWYGEKYFNKRIKGTEKEEKDDGRENFKGSL